MSLGEQKLFFQKNHKDEEILPRYGWMAGKENALVMYL